MRAALAAGSVLVLIGPLVPMGINDGPNVGTDGAGGNTYLSRGQVEKLPLYSKTGAGGVVDPKADKYKYYVMPDCGFAPGDMMNDVMCMRAATGCNNGRFGGGDGPLATIWVQIWTWDGQLKQNWDLVGRTCFPGATPGAGRPMLTITQIVDAFHKTPWAKVVPSMQPPRNVTLVNLATYYKVTWTAEGFQPGEVDTIPRGQMLGNLVEFRPKVVNVTYNFGDGTSIGPTTDLGGTYPNGNITHTYLDPGKFTVRIDATMGADFRLNGGQWTPVPDTATVPGNPVVMTAKTAHAVLIR